MEYFIALAVIGLICYCVYCHGKQTGSRKVTESAGLVRLKTNPWATHTSLRSAGRLRGGPPTVFVRY
jgi:hypothetical protein